MKPFLSSTTLAALCAAWLVSACNTIEGAGQDIQRAGEELEEAAE